MNLANNTNGSSMNDVPHILTPLTLFLVLNGVTQSLNLSTISVTLYVGDPLKMVNNLVKKISNLSKTKLNLFLFRTKWITQFSSVLSWRALCWLRFPRDCLPTAGSSFGVASETPGCRRRSAAGSTETGSTSWTRFVTIASRYSRNLKSTPFAGLTICLYSKNILRKVCICLKPQVPSVRSMNSLSNYIHSLAISTSL